LPAVGSEVLAKYGKPLEAEPVLERFKQVDKMALADSTISASTFAV